MAKLGQTELDEILKRQGWTLQTALDMVYIRTGAVLKAKSLSKMLLDYGALSEPLSALVRLADRHATAMRELELSRAQCSALIGEVNAYRAKAREIQPVSELMRPFT